MVTRVGAAPGPSEATDRLVDEPLTGHAEREASELRLARAVWTAVGVDPDRDPQAGHRLQGGRCGHRATRSDSCTSASRAADGQSADGFARDNFLLFLKAGPAGGKGGPGISHNRSQYAWPLPAGHAAVTVPRLRLRFVPLLLVSHTFSDLLRPLLDRRRIGLDLGVILFDSSQVNACLFRISFNHNKAPISTS